MPHYFRARETAREDALDGLELATFGRRAVGFTIDFIVVVLLRKVIGFGWEAYVPHQWERHTLINFPHAIDVVIFVAFFSLSLYLGQGQTIGKRLTRTRVLSLSHERLSLWHSLERALGYGASFLEGGLGFAQYFTQRNRQCAHDRLAETVVVSVGRSAAARAVSPDGQRPV